MLCGAHVSGCYHRGPHDSAQEVSGAAAGSGTKHTPAAPVGYSLDLNPLLKGILQMQDSLLEF